MRLFSWLRIFLFLGFLQRRHVLFSSYELRDVCLSHSNTGKRLMAKCRLLYQENEELGKMISSGKMAKLEGDLALQKSYCDELKKGQAGKIFPLMFSSFIFTLSYNVLGYYKEEKWQYSAIDGFI